MPKIDNLLVEKFMRIAKIDHLKESFEKKSLKEANFEDKGPDLPKTFNYEGLKKYFDEFDDEQLARQLYLLHQDKKLSSIIDLLKKEVLANTRSSNSERRKAEKLIQAIRDMESSKRVSSKETFVLEKTDPFYDTFNHIFKLLQGESPIQGKDAPISTDESGLLGYELWRPSAYFKSILKNDFKKYLGDPSNEKNLEDEMDVENAIEKMVKSFIKMAYRNLKRLILLFEKRRYSELKKDIYQIITTAIATVSGPEKGDKRAPALESRKKSKLKYSLNENEPESFTNEYFFDKNGSLFITCDRQDPQALEFGPRGCAKRAEIVTLVDRYPPEGVSDLEFIKRMLDVENDREFDMYFETVNGFLKLRERTIRDIGIIASDWHEGEMYESRFANSARLVGKFNAANLKKKINEAEPAGPHRNPGYLIELILTNIVATLEKSETDIKPETFNLLKDLRQTASKLSRDWRDMSAGSSASPKVSEKESSRIKDQLSRLYNGLAMVAQKNSVIQNALRKVYNKWISSYNWPKTSPEVITLQGLLGENLVNESKKKKKKKKAKGPVNKPRRIRKGEPGYGKKKFVVLAKQGSKTKTIKYGDANLEIKRDNPKRRKSFNARHKCKTAKDKLSARYWSCRQWRAGKKVEESLKESHMNNFPYFDYYGGRGKVHDEYRPEEHWMIPDVADNDLNAGVTVDVDLFAEKLAGAIADVFEEMFGNKFNSEISHEELTHCVESALFEKRF